MSNPDRISKQRLGAQIYDLFLTTTIILRILPSTKIEKTSRIQRKLGVIDTIVLHLVTVFSVVSKSLLFRSSTWPPPLICHLSSLGSGKFPCRESPGRPVSPLCQIT